MTGSFCGFGMPLIRRRAFWAVVAFAWTASGMAWAQNVPAGAASPNRGPAKISPWIEMHRKDKQSITPQTSSEALKRLQRTGLQTSHPESEDCAFYVKAPLTPAEIEQYRQSGIIIRETWVPPVPGRHPNGFYLATVPYSQMSAVQADVRVARLASVERVAFPKNDLGRVMTRAKQVFEGVGIPSLSGSGVKIAVADSGFDLFNDDLALSLIEAFDMTTGTGPGDWSGDVANHASPHGTHVLGTIGGRGVNSPTRQYIGVAPDASYALYKIGDNFTAGAAESDMIEAISRAASVGCKIFSMSYGGFDDFLDGSDPICQAIDAANAAGMISFIAAGNDGEGDSISHTTAEEVLGNDFQTVQFHVDNIPFNATDNIVTDIIFNWKDGQQLNDRNVLLQCSNLGSGEFLIDAGGDMSPRGTEVGRFRLIPNVPPHQEKTYDFTVMNSSDVTIKVQLYSFPFSPTDRVFVPFNPHYMISSPAVADTAIAVGAWTHRNSFTNFRGDSFSAPSFILNTLAPFSSHGPRVDEFQKPQIVAPGAATISVRDPLVTNDDLMIDNDGLNQDGSGPADYLVMAGTSMATPHAAGIGALLLEADPNLSFGSLLNILQSTAVPEDLNIPSPDSGYGLVDAFAAAHFILDPTLGPIDPPGTGALFVTIRPNAAKAAGGRWRRVGTTDWLPSGDETGIAPGTYSVEFQPLSGGWVTPETIDGVVVEPDVRTFVAGTYITSGLRVTIQPPAAAAAGGRWRRVGTTDWNPSGFTESPLTPGVYAVEFLPIPGSGFIPPLSIQDIVVAEAQTTNVTGFYQRVGGFAWSTYLGGTSFDAASAITSDTSGNVYVTGSTLSSGWPINGFDTTKNGAYDAFVAKFTGNGELVWSTYLGGTRDDAGTGIAVDVSGNVYVTGTTSSAAWVSGGFDTTQNGGVDGFVIKLSASGQPMWSTYLGGAGTDTPTGIVIDHDFNLLVSGYTSSLGWTHGGFDSSQNGGDDAFLVKLSNPGAHLWSTYLGGSKNDYANGVSVDASNNVLVVGSTTSAGWLSGGFDTTFNGGTTSGDAYVAKLSKTGQFLWSTYVGGSNDEAGKGIAVDPSGNAYITGSTNSQGWIHNGPTTVFVGGIDAFVAKLSASGGFIWSTYLGGVGDDRGRSIAVDAFSKIFVVGDTFSSGWLTTGAYSGGDDGFIFKLDDGDLAHPGQTIWSTFVGGAKDDQVLGVAIDPSGNALLCGLTYSPGWTANGFKTTFGGSDDIFAGKIGDSAAGALQVTLAPDEAVAAGAQWRIVGTQTYLNSGVTENGLPTGPINVEFKPVPGFQAPVPQQTSIISNQVVGIVGFYTAQESAAKPGLWTLFK